MSKSITLQQAVDMVQDGMTVMVGGFLSCGSANTILTALSKTGVRNLTMICNDTAYPDRGNGQLIVGGQVSRVIVSHIGTNPVTGEKMNSGELKVDFVPQGTLAEAIRAAGAGLGGVLTTTGLGTICAEGHQIVTVDGRDFLLEKPIHADLAIIGASVADTEGNLVYKGTTQNFNPLMAMAADKVIVEADEVVPVGSIPPEQVHTPSIFVDYIVKKGN